MENNEFKVTLMKAEEVAKLFKTTHPKIKSAIRNGTLPIGFVADGDANHADRVFIVEERLKAYLNADDLKLAKT